MIKVSSDESSADKSNNQRQIKRWVIWHMSAGALGVIAGFFSYSVFRAKATAINRRGCLGEPT
jgi:hypothetical protein